jgi:putative ABC transport system permease protein
VYQQLNFMRDQDLGMELDQVLAVEGPMIVEDAAIYASKIQALKQGLLNLSNVSNVSGSGALPGLGYKFMGSTSSVSRVGQDTQNSGYTYYWVGVDHQFIETFDLQIVAGRSFSESGNEKKVILNEEAVRLLGFESAEAALDQNLNIGDQVTIIGVIENYNHHSLKSKYDPMIFVYDPGSIFLCLKLTTTDIRSSIEQVKATYQRVFPDDNFTFFFMDELYNQQYQADVRFGKVFFIFAILAIVIACLGLFGLTSYAATQKKKEIGVRKVIGASIAQIVVLLSRDYIRLVLISLIIGVPLAGYLLITWLDNFAFRMDMTWWIFAVPAIMVLIIALAAVSFQTVIAALANPVDALKNE